MHGLALLHLTGQSINQLSIVGFVIALGLLVDDSVVVVENIVRFLRLGYSPKQAAIKATEQITISILGCTATLILAFVPLLALPGAPGLFIRSMPLAVVFTILASLLVALTIVPFLSSRWLKPEGEHGDAVFRAMTWAIEGSYRRVLSAAIGRPKTALAVSLALVAASFALVPRIGFSLFPKAGIPQFLVSVETPEGSSLAETDRVVSEVEAILLARRDVKNVVANVGKGNPRIYYNVAPRNEKSSVGEVFAELADREPHAVERAFKELRDALAAIPGANVEVREMENGPPLDAPVALRVLGDEPEAIEEGARRVEAVLREVRGTRYVRNPSRDRKSDLRVVIDREKGVRIAPAGEIESRQESFGGLGSAIVIAAFGVLAVLVLEFRTFKSTLIVASVIPLGVAGGLLALWLAGYTLSFTANIGFIALMGIEVKNSILLVDFTNQLRAEGRSLDEAVQKAGEIRFVPILLTTLTALGGLVPLVLERSALYSPLAVVLVGGLTSSTLLARVVTPVLYKLLAPEVAADDEAESAPVPAAA